MNKLTPQQIELIEYIKQGTHCIEMPDNPTQDDVKIFRKIRDEYFQNDCSIIENIGKFYNIVSRQKEDAERFAFWRFPIRDSYFNDMIPIPLSSFSQPQPKVVEVEKYLLEDFVEFLIENYKIESAMKRTIMHGNNTEHSFEDRVTNEPFLIQEIAEIYAIKKGFAGTDAFDSKFLNQL